MTEALALAAWDDAVHLESARARLKKLAQDGGGGPVLAEHSFVVALEAAALASEAADLDHAKRHAAADAKVDEPCRAEQQSFFDSVADADARLPVVQALMARRSDEAQALATKALASGEHLAARRALAIVAALREDVAARETTSTLLDADDPWRVYAASLDAPVQPLPPMAAAEPAWVRLRYAEVRARLLTGPSRMDASAMSTILVENPAHEGARRWVEWSKE